MIRLVAGKPGKEKRKEAKGKNSGKKKSAKQYCPEREKGKDSNFSLIRKNYN